MQPKIYHASDHDIDLSAIDPDAIQIIERLKNAGHTAYLVGGSVRDLLVKKKPKDFDISTSARPEEIKYLFSRQCMLIGRRFRLAHIRFGNKIFEVSTFRAGENDSDLIVHDNLWGSEEEDVLRRDFTINGLYYDPSTHTVIDYVGGWEDIHKHVLRTIGDPVTRFKQDPVRMIRLLKFESRFHFHIDPATKTALKRCHQEIIKSSPARILEEILRMLESGASAPFFRLMVETEMLEPLFPCLTFFLKGKGAEDVYRLLSAADQHNNLSLKRPLDRAVLTACLLYPMLEGEIHHKHFKIGHTPHFGDIILLTGSIIKGVLTASFSHFPKRLTMLISYILSAQYRLTPLSSSRKQHHLKSIHNKEFELALQFLMLRARVDEKLMDSYNRWAHLYRDIEKQSEHRGHRPHSAPHSARKRNSREMKEHHDELLATLQDDPQQDFS